MIQRSYLQETLNLLKEASKIKYSTVSALGTYLVLYTSFIPFSNNILEVFYPAIKTTYVPAADATMTTVIWCMSMCFQTTIIIFLQFLKPYVLSYVFPIFTSLYSTSFYVLYLFGKVPNEDFWFFLYIIAIALSIVFFMHSISLFIKVQKLREEIMIKTYKTINQINNNQTIQSK